MQVSSLITRQHAVSHSSAQHTDTPSELSDLATATLTANSQKGFRSLTKNVKHLKGDKETSWKQLNEKLDQLPQVQEKNSQLIDAMNRGDWLDPIFKDRSLYPYYALAGVRNGVMPIEQFTTLMIYWSITAHHQPEDIRVVGLFNAEGINPEASQVIEQTLKPVNSVAQIWHSMPCTKKLLKAFFSTMQEKPLSERHYFVMNDISPISTASHLEFTISMAIFKGAGNNVFSRFSDGKKDLRMFPSFGMMQTYLKVRYKAPVRMKPTIGSSPFCKIVKNGRRMTRELGLPFHGFDLPKRADSYGVQQIYDFIFHDFYHAQVVSNIPEKEQKAFIALADEIKGLRERAESNEYKAFLSALRANFIDMEHSLYAAELKFNYFWETIFSAPDVVVMQITLKQLIKIEGTEPNRLREKIKLEISGLLAKENFYKEFAQCILSKQSEWEEQYSINFEYLLTNNIVAAGSLFAIRKASSEMKVKFADELHDAYLERNDVRPPSPDPVIFNYTPREKLERVPPSFRF